MNDNMYHIRKRMELYYRLNIDRVLAKIYRMYNLKFLHVICFQMS